MQSTLRARSKPEQDSHIVRFDDLEEYDRFTRRYLPRMIESAAPSHMINIDDDEDRQAMSHSKTLGPGRSRALVIISYDGWTPTSANSERALHTFLRAESVEVGPNAIYTTKIFTVEGQRRRSFAADVYESALEVAARESFETWQAEVSSTNAASIRLHEKLGFVHVSDPVGGLVFFEKQLYM